VLGRPASNHPVAASCYWELSQEYQAGPTAIATEPCDVAFLDKRGAEALFDSSSELSLRLLHINGPKLYELELWNYNHLRRKCGLEPIEG
jgi:hypothetical protein